MTMLQSMKDSQSAFMQEVRAKIKQPSGPPSVVPKNKIHNKSIKGEKYTKQDVFNLKTG